MRLLPIFKGGVQIAEARVSDEDAALGEVAWRLTHDGYVYRTPRSGVEYLHRLVLGLSRGDRRQGDHIDRDKLNCTRENLRIVTMAQNAQNKRGYGRSQYRGVAWEPRVGRWRAYGKINGKYKSLGTHATEEEAAAVAAAWRIEHMTHTVEAR